MMFKSKKTYGGVYDQNVIRYKLNTTYYQIYICFKNLEYYLKTWTRIRNLKAWTGLKCEKRFRSVLEFVFSLIASEYGLLKLKIVNLTDVEGK